MCRNSRPWTRKATETAPCSPRGASETVRAAPGVRSATGDEKLLPDTTTCLRVSVLLFVIVHRVRAEHETQLAAMAAMAAMRGRRLGMDTWPRGALSRVS